MARVPLDEELDDDRDEVSDDSEETDDDPPPRKSKKARPKKKTPEPPPPKPRRRGKWLLLLILLGGVVIAGPALIAASPARNYLLRIALPKFPGRASIDGATFSWWKPLALDGVIVTGADGEEMLRIPRLQSDRTLWDLIREPTKLGAFRIEKPVVTITTQPGGSNIEEALTPLFSTQRNSKPTVLEYRIEVVDGQIDLVSDDASERSVIHEVQATIDCSADPKSGLLVRVEGRIAGDESESPGKIDLNVTLAEADPIGKNAAETKPAPELRGTFRASKVSLASLEPVWKRLEATMEVGGEFDADLKLRGEFSDDPLKSRIGAGGTAQITQLRCRADRWLAGDQLRLSEVQWSGSVEQVGAQLVANRAVFTTQPVRIEADGTFPLPGAGDLASLSQTWKTLSSQNYTLNAEADLAQLATLVPRALRIRDDVEITAGKGLISLKSHEENGERVITADLQTTDLAARSPQGGFTWPEPIQAALTARMGSDGPEIDRLACRASFLEVAGKGTLRQARILAKCDLNRFTTDAGRFLDLSELQLGGRMTADAECRQAEEDHLVATGRVFLDDFVWAAPGREAYREKQLKVEFASDMIARDLQPSRVASGSFKLTGGTDELTVELMRPIALDEVQHHRGDVPLKFAMNGPLSLWQQRVSPWLPLKDVTLSGESDLSGQMAWNTEEIHVAELQGTLRNLEIQTVDSLFREQWVQLAGVATWKTAGPQFIIDEFVANGSSLAAKLEKVSLTLPLVGTPSVVGSIAFRGDLDRLMSVGASPSSSSVRLKGQASGRLRASQVGDLIQADGEVRIEDAVVVRNSASSSPAARAPTSEQPWGNVVVLLDGEYNRSTDGLNLKAFSVSSTPLKIEARGNVSRLSAEPWADLSGTLNYDWHQLQGWVTQIAGQQVQLTGRQSDAFTFRGPLSAAQTTTARTPASNVSLSRKPDLIPERISPTASQNSPGPWDRAQGQAKTGWEQANVYGVSTGAAQMTLRLADGVLRAEGLDVDVSGGRITASPVVFLNQSPMVMQHDKGRIADNVRFTPEMCKQWVKYVAPLLADATEIDGRFTLDLQGANVPLEEPKSSDVHGFLIVPRADVKPGALANQILQVARQIEVLLKRRSPDRVIKPADPFLVLRDQNIEFRMVDGRVHHRGVEILVGEDVTVKTRGSVGLDDSIDLVAEIPVRDEWIRKDRVLASLQGQTLQIPIRGTLSKPQIDQRAFDDVARRLASGAVTKGIEDELSNQLDKLLRRNK